MGRVSGTFGEVALLWHLSVALLLSFCLGNKKKQFTVQKSRKGTTGMEVWTERVEPSPLQGFLENSFSQVLKQPMAKRV